MVLFGQTLRQQLVVHKRKGRTGIAPHDILGISAVHAEDTDEIEVVTMTVDRIKELILSGGMLDGKSIAALLIYLEFQRTNSSA